MATLYEIASKIQQTDDTGRVQKTSPSVVAAIKPEKFDYRAGVRRLSPAQLCSLEVPTLARSNGGFRGFQRPALSRHARKIARALDAGKDMPPIDVSITPDGKAILTDGQHRALAAIIAGSSLLATFTQRTERAAQQVFADQRLARRPNPNVLVLAADDPVSEYVQDACTTSDSPWADLVGQGASANRISPKQMHDIVGGYCTDALGWKGSTPVKFDASFADEMAGLLRAFGTKATNPLAYRPNALNAITDAAVLVIRRQGSKQKDVDRWVSHMPTFQFANYAHLRRRKELVAALIDHWNKRLVTNRVQYESR